MGYLLGTGRGCRIQKSLKYWLNRDRGSPVCRLLVLKTVPSWSRHCWVPGSFEVAESLLEEALLCFSVLRSFAPLVNYYC